MQESLGFLHLLEALAGHLIEAKPQASQSFHEVLRISLLARLV